MTAPNRKRRKGKPMYPRPDERCKPSPMKRYKLPKEEIEKLYGANKGNVEIKDADNVDLSEFGPVDEFGEPIGW